MSQKHTTLHTPHSTPHTPHSITPGYAMESTLESTHWPRPWLVGYVKSCQPPTGVVQYWSETAFIWSRDLRTHTHTHARPIVSHFVLNYTLNRIAVTITCGPLFLQPFGHPQHLSLPSPPLTPSSSSAHFNPIAGRQLVRLCVWWPHWALDRFLRFFNQVICAKHLAGCGGQEWHWDGVGFDRLLNGLSSSSHK